MRTTQQMSITLPNEMAEEVRRRVASGEYATESEAARERAVEAWLRDSVVPAAAALETDPSRALDAADVRATLAQRRASRR